MRLARRVGVEARPIEEATPRPLGQLLALLATRSASKVTIESFTGERDPRLAGYRVAVCAGHALLVSPSEAAKLIAAGAKDARG